MRRLTLTISALARWLRRPMAILRRGALALPLAGCASAHVPNNAESLYGPETVSSGATHPGQRGGAPRPSSASCPMAGTPDFIQGGDAPTHRSIASRAMRYSIGDRFNILVAGYEDMSGDYMVNADGRVMLPLAGEIAVVGLTNAETETMVQRAFVRVDVLKTGGIPAIVRPVQWGPVNVGVSGAVFAPGRVVINNVHDADKLEKALTRFGDGTLDRFVPAAIRAVGGVRPDADVSHILLLRGGRRFTLDWRGAFTGGPVDDIALIDGDRIVVPEAPCFQSGLVRPSQITPPGIRIFISNAVAPVYSNANAAVSPLATSVPYGTRFLAGLVSANCVGGSLATNAARHAVLISRNPKTLRTEVVQRAIEELVQSEDRDAINPFLMPDDAIACYDSAVTDVAELAAIFGTLTGGGSLLKTIVK